MLTEPNNWPLTAPPYWSSEGWEYEKQLVMQHIRLELRLAKLMRIADKYIDKLKGCELHSIEYKHYFNLADRALDLHEKLCRN